MSFKKKALVSIATGVVAGLAWSTPAWAPFVAGCGVCSESPGASVPALGGIDVGRPASGYCLRSGFGPYCEKAPSPTSAKPSGK